MKTINLIFSSIKEKMYYIIFFLILSVINSYLITLIPIIISYGLNYLLNNDSNFYLIDFLVSLTTDKKMLIIYICGILLFIKIFGSLIVYIRNCCKDKFLMNLQFNLKHKLFYHIQELTYSNYFSNNVADLIQKASSDTNNINTFISTQLTFILDVILLILFSGIQIFRVHYSFMLLIVISFSLIIIVSLWYYKKCIPFVNELIESSNEIYSSLEDVYRNIKYIKLLNNKNNLVDNINKKFEKNRDLNRKRYYYDNLYYSIISNILKIQRPISYILGSFLIYYGIMPISTIIAVLDYSSKIVGSFDGFQHIIEQFNSFNISCKRINKLLLYNIEDSDDYINNIYENYNIKFRNANIKVNDEITLLENLNFDINENEKVMIVGKTGSGKSIFLKTLVGFYKYDGNILINETQLKDINKKQLRDNISLILQDSYIYSKTIEDNIKILNPDINISDVIISSKKFRIHDDIEKLEDKYDTKIGYGGIKLSKGQNQRLVLARSFIKNRNIMIFDDSFSAIDNKNKKQILEELLKEQKNYTLIIASYDIGLAPKFDKVIFIDDKKVICDTHDNLLKNSSYKKIWDLGQNIVGDTYE